MATIEDVARAENVTSKFIRRRLKLAYRAPAVLEKLLVQRVPPAVSLKDLAMVAELAWSQQDAAVFEKS